jgi:hypothetical protein
MNILKLLSFCVVLLGTCLQAHACSLPNDVSKEEYLEAVRLNDLAFRDIEAARNKYAPQAVSWDQMIFKTQNEGLQADMKGGDLPVTTTKLLKSKLHQRVYLVGYVARDELDKNIWRLKIHPNYEYSNPCESSRYDALRLFLSQAQIKNIRKILKNNLIVIDGMVGAGDLSNYTDWGTLVANISDIKYIRPAGHKAINLKSVPLIPPPPILIDLPKNPEKGK